MNWIRINESLPEIGEEVIVRCLGGHIMEGKYIGDIWVDAEYHSDVIEVYCWIPMPEVPE